MATPTHEQQAAIDSEVEFLVVQAFAGSGKTFTLEGIAHANPRARILYLAYSRAIKDAAIGRFPSNVDCKTTHSICWSFGRPYERAGKLGNIKAHHIISAYAQIGMTGDFARALLNTVEAYMHSADEIIGEKHVPADVAEENVPAVVRFASRRIWPGMCDVDNKALPMPYDGYLKLYQLSQPDLSRRYDIILFDEGQDANAVTLDIFLSQSCRLVLVGDRHQSIFGFRRAVNAMERVKADQAVSLTESRRFGPGIAKLATVLLSTFRDEQNPVRSGFPTKPTHFTVDRSRQYTIIGRTNAKLFGQAVAMLGRKRMHFVGGLEKYPFDRMVDVWHLMNRQPSAVKDDLIKTFRDFGSLEDYARKTDDKEILSLIGVVKEYRGKIPTLVSQIKAQAVDFDNREKADVFLSTAHRSKGLEFPQVVLLDDFEDFITESGDFLVLDRPELVQELNLLYVALTRAEEAIEINAQLVAILGAVAARDKEAKAILDRAASRSVVPGESTVQEEGLGTQSAFRYSGGIGTRDESKKRPEDLRAVCALTSGNVGASGDESRAAGSVASGDDIESMVERVVLRQGKLHVTGIAVELGMGRSEVTDVIVRMVRSGRLSHLLFIACPEVSGRLRGVTC